MASVIFYTLTFIGGYLLGRLTVLPSRPQEIVVTMQQIPEPNTVTVNIPHYDDKIAEEPDWIEPPYLDYYATPSDEASF